MISRAVARYRPPATQSACLLEKLHGCERLSRPRSEAIEGELGLLAGFNIHQDVVVLFLGRLTLPIKVRRIVRRQLDARSAREDRVLFGAATAKHQVFHPIDVEESRSCGRAR